MYNDIIEWCIKLNVLISVEKKKRKFRFLTRKNIWLQNSNDAVLLFTKIGTLSKIVSYASFMILDLAIHVLLENLPSIYNR